MVFQKGHNILIKFENAIFMLFARLCFSNKTWIQDLPTSEFTCHSFSCFICSKHIGFFIF